MNEVLEKKLKIIHRLVFVIILIFVATALAKLFRAPIVVFISLVGLILTSSLVFFFIHLAIWRCPSCKKSLGKSNPVPPVCPHCGLTILDEHEARIEHEEQEEHGPEDL